VCVYCVCKLCVYAVCVCSVCMCVHGACQLFGHAGCCSKAPTAASDSQAGQQGGGVHEDYAQGRGQAHEKNAECRAGVLIIMMWEPGQTNTLALVWIEIRS